MLGFRYKPGHEVGQTMANLVLRTQPACYPGCLAPKGVNPSELLSHASWQDATRIWKEDINHRYIGTCRKTQKWITKKIDKVKGFAASRSLKHQYPRIWDIFTGFSSILRGTPMVSPWFFPEYHSADSLIAWIFWVSAVRKMPWTRRVASRVEPTERVPSTASRCRSLLKQEWPWCQVGGNGCSMDVFFSKHVFWTSFYRSVWISFHVFHVFPVFFGSDLPSGYLT